MVYMAMHGLYGNPLCKSQEFGCTYKLIYISVATLPRLFNFTPKLSFETGIVSHDHLCKLSFCIICIFTNINENIRIK